MNLRHRWWMAGVLLSLAAISVQRARAEGASPWPVLPAAATSVRAVTGHAPLALLRPVASETIERALGEADVLYRSGQASQALHAYATLVEIDAANPQAWLRLGNLHQQAGREDEALDAYRRAVRARSATPAEAEARGKSLLNIALLGVADAIRAIDELDAMDLAALDDTRDAVFEQAGAQRRRANRMATRWAAAEGASSARPVPPPAALLPPPAARFPSPVALPAPPSAPLAPPTATAASAPPPAARAAPAVEPFEPYTVDRWVARARRLAGVRTTGRAALSEPVTESPLPPPPVVETFRGGAGGRRP
jgi:tetratricopeptide (TPR) repeat protein